MAATPKLRRTWPQRLTFGLVLLTALACFSTAAALATGQWVISQRQLVDLAEPDSAPTAAGGGLEIVIPGATTTLPDPDAPPPTTIELAEPDAANFLVVGADNGECVDAPVGDRSDLGERSDTIMIWRTNPEDDQLAVLSLPRDLYVDIAGGSKARINSAYRRNDPSRLIDTIFLNFGVPVDHYVQVDFCAFRELVDAVGGVEVPFEFPARDTASGLRIEEVGCVNLDADMALAYVRSRKYQYESPPGSGVWRTDGTSDFGRISRQQDFLRRVVAKVIDEGLYSPSVLTALIDTNREYVVTDTGLTLQRMLEFANTLRRLEPGEITTYRVESTSETTIDGSQVERPRIQNDNMQAILAVFRGEALLAEAPEQVLGESGTSTTIATTTDTTTATTTTAPAASTTTLASADADDDTSDADDPADAPTSATATTLPSVEAEENVVGVAPSRDSTCG